MPTLKLTRRTITAIETPAAGPVYYWDEKLSGFGIVARLSGSRNWIVQYRLGGGRKGVTRRMVIGDSAVLTVEEARAAAKRVLARAAVGEDPAGQRTEARKAETVAEVAERWLAEHVGPKRRPRTRQFYASLLDRHVLPAIGSIKARELTRRDVMKLHVQIATKATRLEKAGKRQPKTRVLGGPVTANRALAALSALFVWAGKAGLVPELHNPAREVERNPEEAKERFLDAAELERLGEALTLAETSGIVWAPQDEAKAGAKHLPKAENRVEVFGPYPSAAIRLLLLTGMRLREVLHLEWSSYDRQRGMLHLPTSKTGKKTVTLGSAAIALLEAIPRVPGGQFVIASTSAGLVDEKPRRDINRAWVAIRRHAELAGVRLHDTRHSFAAIGASGGASMREIGGLLGHTKAQTTMRYSHLSATAERRVADMIGAEIASALGLPCADVVSLDAQRRA